MSLVDNHPATRYPATDAMAAETTAKQLQKNVLEEFLNEDPDMNDTIANLTQLLKHLETAPADTVSYNTLLHIRRSLYSLTALQDLCVE